MHYGGDDGTTADDDIDSKLPGHNTNLHCLSVMYSPMVRNTFSIGAVEYMTSEYNSYVLKGIPSEYTSLILQPPRQA
ncbi:MAG: hypothetical protein HC867_09245 [Bacteroidia bacterium]|nr:hypothetical protein [Bacteroidia bacterium]